MRRTAYVRTCSTVLAASLIVPLVSDAGPATAQVVDNVCNASGELGFDPTLTLTPHSTAMTVSDGALLSCTNPVYPDATINAFGTGPSLCLVIDINGTGSFTWDNGKVSAFTFTVSTDPLTGQLGLSASIISGPFKGDTVEDEPVIVSMAGTCATGGVSALTVDFTGLEFLGA